MGTTAYLIITNEESPLVVVQFQSDGYVEGAGHEIARFLDGKPITNGLGNGFNGVWDLGVRLITALKQDPDRPGHLYLEKPGIRDFAGYEYQYYVSVIGDQYNNPSECTVRIIVKLGAKTLFVGTPAELLSFSDEDATNVYENEEVSVD